MFYLLFKLMFIPALWVYTRHYAEYYANVHALAFITKISLITVAPLSIFLVAFILYSLKLISRVPVWVTAIATAYSGYLSFVYFEYFPYNPLLISASLLTLSAPLLFLLDEKGLLLKNNKTQGSARWISMWQAQKYFSKGSLVIGSAYVPSKAGVLDERLSRTMPLLHFNGEGHLLTVAGSGSGKTVSISVPNCLSWQGNLVAHDPKGELVKLCRVERERQQREVITLNSTLDNTDCLNVIDWLDISSDQVLEDAKAIVSWLGNESASEKKDPFFEDMAKNLILLILLEVIFNPKLAQEEKTLRKVRELITSSILVELIEFIAEKGSNYAFGATQQYANEFKSLAEQSGKTWESIRAVAFKMTDWLSIPSLARLVCGSDNKQLNRTIKTTQLLNGKTDIFVCVPIKTLDSTPAVSRLIFGSLLNTVYNHYQKTGAFNKRTLFLLDEMPRLGYMKLLETARDFGRGAGITLWAIIQDLGQLEKIYGKSGVRSWMANSQIKTFFGIAEYETAEMLSKTLGKETITSKTHTYAMGNTSVNQSEREKDILSAEEIMRLKTDSNGVASEQLVFIRNKRPLRCGMAKYYLRREFIEKCK